MDLLTNNLCRVWIQRLVLQETNLDEFCLILRKKCPYLEFFWSVFSRIWTEYRDLLRKTPNTDTYYAVLLNWEPMISFAAPAIKVNFNFMHWA